MTVPDVVLSPHVDADIELVISAADHVAELLPCSGNGAVPPIVERRGFTVTERLEDRTIEQLKELMRRVV